MLWLLMLSVMGDVEAGLKALKGQPLPAAIAKIGYPMESFKVGDDTVYTWKRQFTTPSYNSGPFAVSGSDEYRCLIRLAVGPDNIIKSGEYDGNDGCAPYAKALRSR